MVPVYGTAADIQRLLIHTDAIEKLRNASDPPHVFLTELIDEQVPLIRDLERRITATVEWALTTPAICSGGADKGASSQLQKSAHDRLRSKRVSRPRQLSEADRLLRVGIESPPTGVVQTSEVHRLQVTAVMLISSQ